MSHMIGESLFSISSAKKPRTGPIQEGEEMPAQLSPGPCPCQTGVGKGWEWGQSFGSVSKRLGISESFSEGLGTAHAPILGGLAPVGGS